MHKEAIKALICRVESLAEEMVYPHNTPGEGSKVIGGEHSTESFALTEEGGRILYETVDYLFKNQKWSSKYSNKFILNLLYEVLDKAAESRNTKGIEIDAYKIAHDFETYDKEQVVVVPLAGLKIDIDGGPLTFLDVTFRQYDNSTWNEMAEKCNKIIMSNTYYDSPFKEQRFQHIKERDLKRFSGRACAETTVLAEPERAREIALERIRFAIDLFRYSILFLLSKDRRREIGVLGNVSDESRVAVAFQADDRNLNIHRQAVNFPVTIDEHFVSVMRAVGVFDLVKIYQNPKRSKFEEVILRAVHWLSSAQSQPQEENALLNLVTCLETFFKVDKETPITSTISEGVALLTATGIDARKYRKKRVQYFYSMRSNLTHGGEGIITNSDLEELTTIARDLTLLMIKQRDNFKDHESFKAWLDEQKLTGTVAFPSQG